MVDKGEVRRVSAGPDQPHAGQILHYGCDKTNDSLSSYTDIGSMFLHEYFNFTKQPTEVAKNHPVYRRKVTKWRLPNAPRTAAAVDHHTEALIATTSQGGRHTHR